ncbi:hypothetical protein [Anaeromyxobacter diazotrophicus]|uniref:Uncharacterized protein n=1 Tax=Anaeromyxobacter diazotrophicus TaxID=2590199 RepID=A0A7I9VHA0_9BACT|nr:hypothetical protein [Anaeromyxobacter diazotrophicus]GEJ55715.1 hypothetical protein AMYX_04560 [Anaeromyxobacter diazotrophicus]
MTTAPIPWLPGLAALALSAGCGGGAGRNPAPLSSGDVNLVFVVSQDLAFQAPGDVDPGTANLSPQGLQRSLLLGTFLRDQVLGGNDVNRIYAVAPTTHLQTAQQLPDLVPLETIEPFAVLNHTTLSSDLAGGSPFTGQNSPIRASYAQGSVPPGVAVPAQYCPTCAGLDFADQGGVNEALVAEILAAGAPGTYVLSAPWETVRALLASVAGAGGRALPVPAAYAGPDRVYALSRSPSGAVALATYDAHLSPAATYPVLPAPVARGTCTPPTPSTLTVRAGVGGAVVPAAANRGETVYIVRHAEAHPQGYWSDNNYVGAGQWRALDLPDALRGKVTPDQVWSQDPATFSRGTVSGVGEQYWSSVAPALTVAPYAIANGLALHLASSLDLTSPDLPRASSDFFFTGGRFSGHDLLLGWTFTQVPQMIAALVASYFPGGGAPQVPAWPPTDYDSLWIVTLDASGDLTLDFSQCEGIDSAALPSTAPRF